MLDVNRLVQSFESAIGWPYVSPGSNDARGIDCSGMFVMAFQAQGAKISHGSNAIWRRHLSQKGEITGEGCLQVGMAVFKWLPKDTAKYPDGLGNFSHIGLVTGIRPLRIVHASTVGMRVKADTSLGRSRQGGYLWKYWGMLSGVPYGTSESASPAVHVQQKPDAAVNTAAPEDTMQVKTSNGGPVKIRAQPSKGCRLYWKVPNGASVQVLERDRHGWFRVQYGKQVGYMDASFLV